MLVALYCYIFSGPPPTVLKVKVKLSLCLTKRHGVKAYWEMEVQLHSFFDISTRLSGQLQAPAALPPGKESLLPIG
jgi:hypothetical protein